MDKTWIKTPEPGVYQLETGYAVLVNITNPRTGKREKREHSSNPTLTTLEEAIEKRDELKALIRGEPAAISQKPTLGAYANEWYEQRKDRLKPSTRRTYYGALKHYIIPELGDLYIECVERRDVIAWVQWAEAQTLNGERYAESTLRGWYRVLSTMLKDMAADHDMPDPTRRVQAPRSTKRRVRTRETLTSEELGNLVEAARVHTPERYAELVTLAYTGMRSGELWALRFSDIDENSAHVCRAVSAGGITDTTKTGWERHVYLPEVVVEAITEHRKAMMRDQHRGLHSGLVFPSDVGTPRTSASLTKVFKKVREKAGIEQHVSPRVLRRTFNTLMAEAGVNELVLRSQMGHSEQDMTLYYFEGHLEAKEAAWADTFQAKV